FQQRKWGIKLSGGAPDVVVRSFAALLPSVTCVVLVWFVVHVLGIDLAGGIAAIFRPLLRGGDSLYAVVIVVLIDSALWLIGVHGIAVLAAVRPLWLAALAENMTAASAGGVPPHVFTQEFFIWFVWQGGSGTTLAFALLLLFARSKQLRLVGKAGIVPAILCLVWWPFVRRYDRQLVAGEAQELPGSTTSSGAIPGRTPSSRERASGNLGRMFAHSAVREIPEQERDPGDLRGDVHAAVQLQRRLRPWSAHPEHPQ